ncbi:MAG: hypothetical protein K2N63_01615 [Lachnospiraceae bacterium]|nr:hypothetical protein [Lachnospiraceae bacterium]
MGHAEELKSLGSILRLSEKNILSVEELPKEEWEQYQHQMLKNLEKQMEYYYMQHSEG